MIYHGSDQDTDYRDDEDMAGGDRRGAKQERKERGVGHHQCGQAALENQTRVGDSCNIGKMVLVSFILFMSSLNEVCLSMSWLGNKADLNLVKERNLNSEDARLIFILFSKENSCMNISLFVIL